MVLNKLNEWPSPKATKLLLVLSIVIFAIIYPFMGYYFLMAENPGNVMESQLSFSAEYMRQYYSAIGNLEFYRLGETLDFGFMISYGLLIFTLALIIARKFGEDSFWRKSGNGIAISGVIAAALDAVENTFILLMLTDPTGFPAFFAIAHSSFALVKWILLITAILWALLALIAKVIKR